MEAMTNYYNNNNQQQMQSSLVSEMIQGMELAKQLRNNLGPESSSSSASTKSALLLQILSSCDKALMLAGHPPTIQQPHQLAPAALFPPVAPSSTPISFSGASSFNAELNVAISGRHHYPQPDEIAAAKKRKGTRNSKATTTRKKVQRPDDDPNISYEGAHITTNKPTIPHPLPPTQNNDLQPLPPPQNNDHRQYDYNSISDFQMGIANLPTLEEMTGSNIGIMDLPALTEVAGLDYPLLFDNSDDHHHLYMDSPSHISPPLSTALQTRAV